jgi:hypothetical protein
VQEVKDGAWTKLGFARGTFDHPGGRVRKISGGNDAGLHDDAWSGAFEMPRHLPALGCQHELDNADSAISPLSFA